MVGPFTIAGVFLVLSIRGIDTTAQNAEKQIDSFWSTPRSNPSRHKLCAATPSSWMKQEAQKHDWSEYEVHSIHNPLPDFFFADIDRKACKQALSLDESKTTVLCVAGNLDEERKGGGYLKDILNTNWGRRCSVSYCRKWVYIIILCFSAKKLGIYSR